MSASWVDLVSVHAARLTRTCALMARTTSTQSDTQAASTFQRADLAPARGVHCTHHSADKERQREGGEGAVTLTDGCASTTSSTSTSTSTPAPGAAAAAGTETDKDCGDLWWWRQDSAYAVDNNVCAYSSVKGPGGGQATCHHRKNHGAAAATCAANGARLCSLAEVQGKVAAGSGCGIDGKLQWTGASCAGGFLAQQGNGGGSAKCLPASSTSPSVRCCAE